MPACANSTGKDVERGKGMGSLVAELGDSQQGTALNAAVSTVRGRMYANLMEISSRCVRKFIDKFDRNNSSPDDQAIFARLERDVDAFIVGGRRVGRSDDRALKFWDGQSADRQPTDCPKKKTQNSPG